MAKKLEIKKILELKKNNISQNEMAKIYHISKTSSMKILNKAKKLNVSYDEIKDKDADYLFNLFFPDKNNKIVYEEPDFEFYQKELAKTGVTLKLLWQEYCDLCEIKDVISIGYNKFCKSYHAYVGTKKVTNHLIHKPAQEIEVDWSGPTMRITDEVTRKKYKAYLFVATLPYSQYTYVEATNNMKQSTWLQCHVNMFKFINGVTRTIICDNLKTGVDSHPREGDIVFNSSYEEFSEHYTVAVLPARVRTPKDKPSVEMSVGNIATAIIAELRNDEFNTLNALNKAIRKKLFEFNNKKFQKKFDGKYSRAEIFFKSEQEYLRSLPKLPYEYGKWTYGRKVYANSHIQYQKNYYSVPHINIGKNVDIKVSENLLRIYLDNKHLVTHRLFEQYEIGKYMTRKQDLPEYFKDIKYDKDYLINWANTVGLNTRRVIELIFESVSIEEKGYNPSLSILRLCEKHKDNTEFELACAYTLTKVSTPRYKHIKAVLHSQVLQNLVQEEKSKIKPKGIMRGADYFKSRKEGVK